MRLQLLHYCQRPFKTKLLVAFEKFMVWLFSKLLFKEFKWYVLIKTELLLFQKGIFFHGEKLLCILQNVIFNPFLFTFLIFYELRKEKWENGKETIESLKSYLLSLICATFDFSIFTRYTLLIFLTNNFCFCLSCESRPKVSISSSLFIIFS